MKKSKWSMITLIAAAIMLVWGFTDSAPADQHRKGKMKDSEKPEWRKNAEEYKTMGCCGSQKKSGETMHKKMHGKKAEWKSQETCPVMGGKINKSIHADHKGQRVYFCCDSCVSKFRENPEKYISKMKEQGVKPEDVRKPQETCPVMGGKINKNIYADHKGERVYFCCNSCVSKFRENPEKYISELKDQGVNLKDIRKQQETCPVMGGKINKDIHADHNGERVYFCCNSCVNRFRENPEKYMNKLREKGEKPENIAQEKTEEKQNM